MRNTELQVVDDLLMLAYGTESRRRELELYLAAEGVSWLVAEQEGRIVATGGCLFYGTFAWIGLVATDPTARGQGLATAISERLLSEAHARGAPTVALDASADGRPIYKRLGFRDIGQTCELWAQSPRETREAGHAVAPICADLLPELQDFDAQVFGGDRSSLLAQLVATCGPRSRVSRDSHGRLNGYLFVQGELAGPGAAADEDTASALLEEALTTSEARQRILVPTESVFLGLVRAAGFQESRRLTHMRHGGDRLPGERGLLFAQTSYAAG